MNIQAGDLMKYFDGINEYLCIIAKVDGKQFIVSWLNDDQTYYFHTRIHFNDIQPRFGWSKLS